MKKSILLGIIGVAATAATSALGQGSILLSNYVSSSNIPNMIKLGGNPLASGYTVGMYWVAGNVAGSVASDPTGIADPSTLGGGLVLATANGSSTPIGFAGYPGSYQAGSVFVTGLGASAVITLEIVAYNGANYLSSTSRGHSGAFSMTTSSGPGPTPPQAGVSETDGGFSVFAAVPEPTTMALGGLGLASLLLFRRKQA